MKNEKKPKATNLKLGAIYINGITGQICRLVNIISCQGVWLETYDSLGYGKTVKFENVFYADLDQVKDFLEDLQTFKNVKSVDVYENENGYLGDCYIDQLEQFDHEPNVYSGTYSEE